MIERNLTRSLKQLAKKFPAVTITGPRQSGKSTLCRAVFPDHPYANLEAPDVRAFATEDPRGFLGQYPKGAVIDEIQRCPTLPSYLQEKIDGDPKPGRWILTGSQNLSLLQSVSQSLAGRTAVLHLLPLSYDEVCRFKKYPKTLDETILTGGYPRILDRHIPPTDWFQSYVATYIERDVRTISNIGDLTTFQRFVQLCAGRTSQLLNLTGLAGDCGISQPTAKAWLSVLETSFIAFTLPGYSGNLRKRLVKMPKLHFYDSGLVCWLLGIRDVGQLHTHPLRGAIFETWVVSEIVKQRMNQNKPGGLFFYRDQHGLEADMIIENGKQYTLLEIKAGQTPSGDMLNAVSRIGEVFKAIGKTQVLAVYGGHMKQARKKGSLLPWKMVHEISW
jgi:predicted AAA+ superfamily ATPase